MWGPATAPEGWVVWGSATSSELQLKDLPPLPHPQLPTRCRKATPTTLTSLCPLQTKVLICRYSARLVDEATGARGGWLTDLYTCMGLCQGAQADIVNIAFGDMSKKFLIGEWGGEGRGGEGRGGGGEAAAPPVPHLLSSMSELRPPVMPPMASPSLLSGPPAP